ncbi:MAG: PIG-L family deacetylase, partial [Rhodothermia bacterium]
MSVDVLAIGAHPDDVELGCGGAIRKMVDQGYQVGVIDLTEGELGSRGSVETRRHESAKAVEILGVQERVNLGIPDGRIENSKSNQLKVIEVVRRLRPEIVLIGAP